eukprot:862538-Pelagomonas_calceolata.AAC.1
MAMFDACAGIWRQYKLTKPAPQGLLLRAFVIILPATLWRLPESMWSALPNWREPGRGHDGSCGCARNMPSFTSLANQKICENGLLLTRVNMVLICQPANLLTRKSATPSGLLLRLLGRRFIYIGLDYGSSAGQIVTANTQKVVQIARMPATSTKITLKQQINVIKYRTGT